MKCSKEPFDVAFGDPPDEVLSCRRRVWDVPHSGTPKQIQETATAQVSLLEFSE